MSKRITKVEKYIYILITPANLYVKWASKSINKTDQQIYLKNVLVRLKLK